MCSCTKNVCCDAKIPVIADHTRLDTFKFEQGSSSVTLSGLSWTLYSRQIPSLTFWYFLDNEVKEFLSLCLRQILWIVKAKVL